MTSPILQSLSALSTQILSMEGSEGFKRGNLALDAAKAADALAAALWAEFDAQSSAHFAAQDVRQDALEGVGR